MKRVLTTGPELALRSGMTEAVMGQGAPSVPPTEGPMGWRALGRRPRPEVLFPLAFYAVTSSVLLASGYPALRIVVLALAAVVQQFQYHLAFTCAGHDPRRCVNADPDRVAWRIALTQSSVLLTTGLAVAVTGGIRSPLLVTVLAAYLAAVAAVGDGFQTRLLLFATSAGVCVIALLPRTLTGPQMPEGAFGVLAALSVLGVGALLAPTLSIVRGRRDALARWRKDVAADALQRAQNLEQIGAKLAHELKNPLTAVKALIQLGLRTGSEASSHERLEIVDREVARMQDLLQNYLSFTRPLQEVMPRRIGLGSLVSDTLDVLSARADDAQVRLFAQGDAVVEADSRRLKEALLNLVANAIEATPPGWQVLVEVRSRGELAEIAVRDTGRGMAPDTLRRVGTPFFTTRAQGTGLGVVLARSVIAQHGGTLRYESEPGKGTLVSLTLPLVTTGAAGASRVARG